MRRFGALLLLTITLLAGCGGRESPVSPDEAPETALTERLQSRKKRTAMEKSSTLFCGTKQAETAFSSNVHNLVIEPCGISLYTVQQLNN